MTKNLLNIKKVLATLLTIAALATGQQAFATVSQTVTFQGMTYTQNNNSYYGLQINGIPWGNLQLPNQQGTSCQFNNAHLSWGPVFVTLNGNLRFKESTTPTDVVVYGSTFTVTFESQSLWFYGASVKKLDGTNVTNSNVTVSSDKHTVTVTINGNGTEFGQIILNYVPNEPFNSTNTVVSGIEPLYIWNGSPITFEPPTVTYNGNVLTEGTDYTVSYPDTGTNPLWNIWDQSVIITGTGNYAGTFYQHFIYRNVNLTDFTQLNDGSYQIATQQDLDYLALYVGTISQINNSYQYNYCEGLTFKQTADIAYTYTTAWDGSGNETNFTAIGGWGRPFKGTFDGQNHTISGIRISKTGCADSDKCQGLFGIVDNGGTVKNVVLADTRIKGYTSTGGIVGTNYGTIEDCRVQNNVLIRSSGKVVAGNHGSDFGGIAGSNENGGTVTRCTSSVTIDGYVGTTSGSSINPQPIYSVCLGAIVGSNGGTLTANYYRGCTVINSNNPNGTSIGIGVGTVTGSQDQDGARSVHNLTLGENITATGESVVIDGTTYYASNTTVTLGYSGTVPAGQMPVYKVGSNTLEGNTFTMPAADRTVSVVGIVDAWSGSGTSGSPYVITNTAQLNALASAVKGGEAYSGTYFVLGNDIAYSTAGLGDTDENFTTIGGYFNGGDKNFSGTFDGQGYTISGIRLYKTGSGNPSKNQGLFGRISGATIKNVILTDARITGYNYVGGLVGNIDSGTVQNCLVLASTITCDNTNRGALFGKNSGTITRNYYVTCTVGVANATGVGCSNADVTANDGAVPGNARTISGYGNSEEIGWAFIASPLTNIITPASVMGLNDAPEYDLYRLNPSNTMWENWKQAGEHYHFNLENGRGYLYATQEQETIKFYGMNASAYNLDNTKTVTLGEGFNLVGNPFPRAAYINKPYYTLNADGSAVLTISESAATPISPCYSVVVEATGTENLTFSITPQTANAPSNGSLNIALVQGDAGRGTAGRETLLDNAIVSFNEGEELGKFYFGHQNANIYIPQGNQDYAIAFSDKQGEMPLNFKAKENGSYTITVNPEGVEMGYLHLIDNLTGADVDLLTQASYTFQTKTTDYESRFKLVFSSVCEDADDDNETFAFFSNGNIIVTGTGTLQFFDALGRQVMRKQLSTVYAQLSTANFPAGVYMIRLINGENVRTQKVVVK